LFTIEVLWVVRDLIVPKIWLDASSATSLRKETMTIPQNLASPKRSKTHRSLAAVVAFGMLPALAVSANSGVASAQSSTPAVTQSALSIAALRTITATGTGSVSTVPDRLFLNIGVQTSAPKVSDALKANNVSAQSLITALKEKGIEDKDIKTSQLSIYPQFDSAGRKVTSYQVTNSVTVTVRKIDSSGDLIDAASNVTGDAIRISGLNFAVSDPSPSLAAARDLAVKDATTQAEQLAKAAGVKLGKIRSIQTAGSGNSTPIYRAAAVADKASTPIAEGTQEITASVELVFDISE
jgi:uncharacterized protein